MSFIPQSFLQDVWVRKTLGFTGYTFLLYDYVLTFDTEVEFIWHGPWTATKAIFLINRYGNILGQTFIQVLETGWVVKGSVQLCVDFNMCLTILISLSQESIHILVLLRAWAIWGCQKRVATALVASYVIYLVPLLAMAYFGPKSSNFHEFQYLDLIGICVGVIPPLTWIINVASLLQDTVVFGITMLSLRRQSRESRYLYPSPLLRLLVRDAVVFYVVSVFFDVFTGIAWSVYASSPKSLLFSTLALNLLSVTGQRFVLNLRGLKARSYSPHSLSAEVNRQIGMIDDARPDWWRSKSEGSDGLGYAAPYASGSASSGRENSRLVSGDLEMAVLDHDSSGRGPPAGLGAPGQTPEGTQVLRLSEEIIRTVERSRT